MDILDEELNVQHPTFKLFRLGIKISDKNRIIKLDPIGQQHIIQEKDSVEEETSN